MSPSFEEVLSWATAGMMGMAFVCSLVALCRAKRACAVADHAAVISHDAKAQATYAESLARRAFGTIKPEATR